LRFQYETNGFQDSGLIDMDRSQWLYLNLPRSLYPGVRPKNKELNAPPERGKCNA